MSAWDVLLEALKEEHEMQGPVTSETLEARYDIKSYPSDYPIYPIRAPRLRQWWQFWKLKSRLRAMVKRPEA